MLRFVTDTINKSEIHTLGQSRFSRRLTQLLNGGQEKANILKLNSLTAPELYFNSMNLCIISREYL